MSSEFLKNALVPENEQPYKLPNGWVWVRLGSVVDVVTGNTPSKQNEEFWNVNEFPFVRPSDLDQGRHLTYATEGFSLKAKQNARVIPKQSTLLCCIGTIGKAAFNEIECSTNQQINSLVSNTTIINPLFTYFNTITPYFNQLLNYSSSATTISIINKSKCEALPFPLPPLPEQKRIVDKLDSLLGKIKEATALINEAKESFANRRSAILHKAFTGELTANWRAENQMDDARKLLEQINVEKLNKYNEDCLIAQKASKPKPKKPEILPIEEMLVRESEQPYKLPDGWVWVRLGCVAEVKGGKRLPQGFQVQDARTNYPYIRVTDFENQTIKIDSVKYITEEAAKQIKNYIISNDDLYISIAGTIGKVGFIPIILEGANLTENAAKITNFNSIDKFFLCYLLSSPQLQFNIKESTVSTSQPKLALFRIENLTVMIPPLSEQNEIVIRIEALLKAEDEAKELLEMDEQIDLIEKAVLSKAFRGELGTQYASDEPAVELLKRLAGEDMVKKRK